MKFIDFNGKQIAYSSEGKGIAVVLVHGFCEDSSVWDDFKLDLIEEAHRVICVDLPGFGKSDVIEGSSIETHAEIINTLIQTLALEQIILIGHSMGGYISLTFAKKYPKKLIGLGLFHSHPYADSNDKKAGRQKGINFIKKHGHALFIKQLIPNLFARNFVNSNAFLLEKLSYKAVAYPSKGIISALEAMKNRPDQTAVLKKADYPVLFIIGKKDTVVPEQFSMDQTHLPKIASIHILEKVGHMGMFEARRQCQLIVRQFTEFCVKKLKQYNMKILLILLAILPGLAICYYIYQADKYEKENRLPLIISFFLGMVITWPAIKLEAWVSEFGLENTANLGIAFLASFIAVALIEEVLKFLCLFFYPFQKSFFNEPFDGIVYAVMIGMGFATLENIMYALRYGFETTLLRIFTAVPAHAVFAILMGFYIGRAKFKPRKKRKLLFAGLGIAIAVHGIYDFFIIQEAVEWLIIFAIVTLIISIYFAQKLIKEQQRESPFRPSVHWSEEEE